MKMIVAMVDDTISSEITNALLEGNYRVTEMATTSGFLRGGATTLMVGVDDDLVEKALQIIRDTVPKTSDPENKIATIYVLNVKNFNRL